MTTRSIARPLAACIGTFTLLNILGGILRPGFDANLWWIDLRFMPSACASLLLAALATVLIAFAIRPVMGRARRATMFTLVSAAVCAALMNSATFFSLMLRGSIDAGVRVPLSCITVAVLITILLAMRRDQSHRDVWTTRRPGSLRERLLTRKAIAASLTFAIVLLGFPLAQMFFFGKTDYRRAADAIIVPGARAYADGRPSDALADRVRTACDLYHEGRAPLLIFSGGPGDGDVHETESMRRFAMSLGVPSDAILLDTEGRSTQATAEGTNAMFDGLNVERVLVVSHFYHLPRLKLAYQRLGREVFTVPARETYTLKVLPAYLGREVAAIWWYYLRPLVA